MGPSHPHPCSVVCHFSHQLFRPKHPGPWARAVLWLVARRLSRTVGGFGEHAPVPIPTSRSPSRVTRGSPISLNPRTVTRPPSPAMPCHVQTKNAVPGDWRRRAHAVRSEPGADGIADEGGHCVCRPQDNIPQQIISVAFFVDRFRLL